MSDQPPWDQNIERRIPGLREAVSNLATAASNSGFRVATIVFAPDHQRAATNVPPTRIAFTSEEEAESPTLATTTEALERWAGAHSSGPQWRITEEVPATSHVPQERGTEQGTLPLRSKRASTSVVEGESDAGSQFGKRKRFSEPPSGGYASPSGAFWGTVLEERPGTPQGMPAERRPSQPPPLVGPSQMPAELQRPLPPSREALRWGQTETGTDEIESDRVQRYSTFPALRLRSPIGQRQRESVLPSLQEPLFGTPGQVFRDRFAPSPASAQPRRQPLEGRFFRRTASHLLGRLSPFGAPRPSASRGPVSTPPLNVESQFYTGRASGLPAVEGAIQRPAGELFTQPATGDILQTQVFPTMQRAPQEGVVGQYGTSLTQHSGSRSASGSGASQAQPSGATASPGEVSEIQRGPASTRGKRGRRLGTSHERDHWFECERCSQKFRRKSDKNRHVRVVHDKSRPFMCPLCSKTFGEKSNMLKHRASVHDDVRTFRCPYCDMSFAQRGLCDNHVRSVHDKKQAKYFCEHCGLPFSRKAELSDHQKEAHPELGAPYRQYYVGGPSSAAGMASAPVAARDAARDDGNLVGDTIQPVQHQEPAVGILPSFAGSGPAEGTTTPPTGLQYPLPHLPPQPEYQETEDDSDRRRSFQEDSSR